MNQTSLKTLFIYSSSENIQYIPFITYPGAIDCLSNLSELNCDSGISFEFFHPLSQISHNIQTLVITTTHGQILNENGLSDLISGQKNLKHLIIRTCYNDDNNFEKINLLLTNPPNTLIKLKLDVETFYVPLSFITDFTNLQELELTFYYHDDECFKILQHVKFPQLQILKFYYNCPKHEYLIQFLENNGENLKEFYIDNTNIDSINLAIAKFCPNLKSLHTEFEDDEMETLKMIFNNCQQLESIRIACDNYLNESNLLEIVAKCSPREFHELKIDYGGYQVELFSIELESIFTSWANRTPQKSLSLIIIDDSNRLNKSNIKKESIENFQKLGIIKRFEIVDSEEL